MSPKRIRRIRQSTVSKGVGGEEVAEFVGDFSVWNGKNREQGEPQEYREDSEYRECPARIHDPDAESFRRAEKSFEREWAVKSPAQSDEKGESNYQLNVEATAQRKRERHVSGLLTTKLVGM